MSTIKFTQRTSIGNGRKTNQDSLVAKQGDILETQCGLFCIADGVGGLAKGHRASAIAAQMVTQWWDSGLEPLAPDTLPNGPAVCHQLIKLFTAINQAIMDEAQLQGIRMGTTCSLLLVCGKSYYIAHAGDSRIYKIQRRLLPLTGSKIVLQTEDHSVEAELQRQGASVTEIDANPQKNRITSCLGYMEYPKIFTRVGRLKQNEAFVLCSDGVYNVVSPPEMVKLYTQDKQHKNFANKLLETALARETQDNASVIVVTC